MIPFNKKSYKTAGSKRNISIAIRLTVVAVGMLLFLGVTIILFSAINMRQSIIEREKESLRNTAYTLKNAYYVLYEGDFNQLKNDVGFSLEASHETTVEVNELTDVVSSATEELTDAASAATEEVADAVSSATKEKVNAYTIIDTLHEETGVNISIFWGDIRIVTSFKDDSDLIDAGTELEDEARRQVIDLGREYFTESLFMEGQEFYAYYIPIIGGNQVLGAMGVAQNSEVIDSKVTETVKGLLSFGITVIVIAVIVLFLILKRIANIIHEASEALHVIADGDLTLELSNKLLNRRDEIGQLGLSMIGLRDKIKEMLKDIKQSIVTLSSFANELDRDTKKTKLTVDDVAKAMEDIAKGVSSQAEDTQKANYSIIEVGNEISSITDAVNMLKSRAEDISKASQQADVIADKLERSANNTNRAIEKIAIQTEATNAAAEEIRKALDVITDIAKKTNLLSLNASIEAVRAGEQGKGFGVVASEIKFLADQSSKSAKDIEITLGKLLEESEKSLGVVGSVKEIIKDQKDKLEDTRRQFEVVSVGVGVSSSSIESIYEKIMTLDAQRGTLVDTIESLSAISEENAASTEETSASAVELNETVGDIATKASDLRSMSKVLKQSIKNFKLSE